MRSVRVAVLLLCVTLISSGAFAAGAASMCAQGPAEPRLLDLVRTFVQDLLGMQIDPWGRPDSTSVPPGGTEGSDVGPQIDPWGDEGTARPDGPAGNALGPKIDPWG